MLVSETRLKKIKIRLGYRYTVQPKQRNCYFLLNFHVIIVKCRQIYNLMNEKILQSKPAAVVWRKSAELQGRKWITVYQI